MGNTYHGVVTRRPAAHTTGRPWRPFRPCLRSLDIFKPSFQNLRPRVQRDALLVRLDGVVEALQPEKRGALARKAFRPIRLVLHRPVRVFQRAFEIPQTSKRRASVAVNGRELATGGDGKGGKATIAGERSLVSATVFYRCVLFFALVAVGAPETQEMRPEFNGTE